MKVSTKAKIGIFSLTLLAMSTLGITPSIDLIATDLGVDASDVQQLTAIPNLTGIVSALIFSAVGNKIPRKYMAVAAPILIAVGGLLPVFVDGGFTLLLVCSAILGLGVGLVTNTANTLITDLIPVEEQGKTMSQNVIFVNAGSIFMTVVGGLLASGGWRNNYLVYLIAIPVLILVLLFIPMQKVDNPDKTAADAQAEVKAHEAENAEEAPKSSGLKGMSAAIIAAIVILIYNCCFSAFANNAALLMADWMDADSISSWTGIVVAVGTIGGVIAGFTLDYVFKPVKPARSLLASSCSRLQTTSLS